MNLNQLRYFVSVGTYRSFTRAADCHYLTQTAITQQIRALEDSLGLQLVDRQKRPIELTPAGRVFFQEAKDILARMDAAVEKTREASAGLVGTVRIGYEKGYERSALSDRLREFHRVYPNILFTCTRANTDQLSAGLLADEYDVIFSWDGTDLRQNEDIESRLEVRSPLIVALYDGHPLSTRRVLHREDLRDETLFFLTPSSNADTAGDRHFMELYRRAGYTPHILLKSNEAESLLMMVAAEEGITILPAYSVAKLTNADHLVFVPLEGEEEFEELFMMWKRSRRNPALQCFLNYMERF